MKTCTYCGESKPVEAFSRGANKPDGRQDWCKGCYKAYRDSRKDEINRTARNQRKANPEAARARDAIRRERELEKRRAYAREYARKRRAAAKNAS